MTSPVQVAEEPLSIATSVDPKLVGIRGWLFFQAVGLVISLILNAAGLIAGFIFLSDLMSDRYGAIHVLELAVGTGLMLFSIYTVISFFGKKKNAPSLIITLILMQLAASILILGVEFGFGADKLAMKTEEHLILRGINAVIWIPYFMVSKRVKATFVN